jgi:hypothetical protein
MSLRTPAQHRASAAARVRMRGRLSHHWRSRSRRIQGRRWTRERTRLAGRASQRHASARAAVPFIHFRKRSASADVTMGHAEGMVNGFARCQA